MRTFYYDEAFSLLDCLRLCFVTEDLLMINVNTLQLPAELIEDIARTHPERPYIAFEVKVNSSLDSGVSLKLIRPRFKLPILIPLWLISCAKKVRAGAARMLKNILRREVLIPAALISAGRRSASASNDSPSPLVTDRGIVFRIWQVVLMALRNMDRYMRPSFALWDNKISQRFFAVQASPQLRTFLLVDSMEHLKHFRFPAAIHVALTNHCNLKCVMCPYHSPELRKKQVTDYFVESKHFPPELLDELIEEAGRHGAHLAFGQYDEPFIYRNFTEFAVRAKIKGCSVSITTNGILLTENKAERLIAAGIDHISFSMDAATAETYWRIRQHDFDVPLNNLKTLIKVRSRLGGETQVRACMVLQDYNRNEHELFKETMKSVGVDMVSYYVLSRYEDGIWINSKLNFDIEYDKSKRYTCSQLWSQAAVYPDGKVALCCATTLYVGYRNDLPFVGNLQDASLEDIWLSSNYRQIRAEALKGVFANSICRDCQIWHNFQNRASLDHDGNTIQQNPYETFITFKARH